MMDLIYIRTDKNGTKYFHDWQCPRCGGVGFADKWINTGRTCWACGGTGKRSVAKIVKEYTPEYWAKLEARRIARAKKAAENAPKHTPEELAEIARKTIETRYADFGCGKDGVGYVLEGRGTYAIKDAIKRAGGRWIYGRWVCPTEFKADDVSVRKISLAGHIGGGSEMWLDDFDLYDAVTGWEG